MGQEYLLEYITLVKKFYDFYFLDKSLTFEYLYVW